MRNIIILMLFLASSVFASENDYFFVVENATMVDAYFNVFNAMASIFSSDSYYDILKLAFLVGGFFIFAGGILSLVASGGASSGATTLTSFAKYYLTATALLVLLFSVKSTMWVSTNNIPTFCTVTDPGSATTGQAIRMPSVLAFVFSSTNLLGRELTNLAESAFSSASGAPTMVNQGGFAGGVKNTLKILLHESDSDVDFKTGWQLFFSKCVYEVANNKGQEGIDRVSGASGVTGMHGEVGLERSKDLAAWSVQYLNTPFTGTTRKPGESLVDIGGATMTCQNLYDTTLAPSMAMLKAGVGCGLKEVNADTLKLIMGYTAGPGVSDLQTIALQAGLVSSLSDSKRMSSIGVQAGYVSGKTMAETNQNNLNTANYMAEMLPYVQMTMRAILYAFFPFVFVVVILPGGLSVLKSYGQTLAWIELWGPTAAVVNMFVNLQAESKVSGTYTQEGLTMLTSIDMVSEANNIAGIAAMLYLAIPALTWLILKGSGQMLGNFTSGMSAGFTKNLQADAINKDVSGHKTAEEATRQNKENGLNKVVSFGEAQHYAAKTMGVNAGATMSAQMINGLDSVGDSAFQKSGSDYRSASMKKELLGDNSMVIESGAVAAATMAKTTQASQKTLGTLGEDGKTANMNEINTRATKGGIVDAKNTETTQMAEQLKGVFDENGNINKEAYNTWSRSESGQKFMSDLTHKQTVDQIGKRFGLDQSQTEKLIAGVDATKNEVDKSVTKNIQGAFGSDALVKTNTEEEKYNHNVKVGKQEILDQGTRAKYDSTESMTNTLTAGAVQNNSSMKDRVVTDSTAKLENLATNRNEQRATGAQTPEGETNMNRVEKIGKGTGEYSGATKLTKEEVMDEVTVKEKVAVDAGKEIESIKKEQQEIKSYSEFLNNTEKAETLKLIDSTAKKLQADEGMSAENARLAATSMVMTGLAQNNRSDKNVTASFLNQTKEGLDRFAESEITQKTSMRNNAASELEEARKVEAQLTKSSRAEAIKTQLSADGELSERDKKAYETVKNHEDAKMNAVKDKIKTLEGVQKLSDKEIKESAYAKRDEAFNKVIETLEKKGLINKGEDGKIKYNDTVDNINAMPDSAEKTMAIKSIMGHQDGNHLRKQVGVDGKEYTLSYDISGRRVSDLVQTERGFKNVVELRDDIGGYVLDAVGKDNQAMLALGNSTISAIGNVVAVGKLAKVVTDVAATPIKTAVTTFKNVKNEATVVLPKVKPGDLGVKPTEAAKNFNKKDVKDVDLGGKPKVNKPAKENGTYTNKPLGNGGYGDFSSK